MNKKVVSIKIKLFILTGALSAIFIFFLFWGFSIFRKNEGILLSQHQEVVKGLVYVMEMTSGVADIKARTFSYVISGETNPDGRLLSQIIQERIGEVKDNAIKYYDFEYSKNSVEEQEAATNILTGVNKFSEVIQEAIQKKKSGVDKDELLAELDGQYKEVYFPLVYFLNQHKDEHLSYVEKFALEARVASNKVSNIIFVSFLLLFLSPFVVSAILFFYLVKPLEKLRLAVEKVASGDFSERISLKRKDELGDLAVSFNEMASELEKNKKNLDKKIVERTSDLEKLNQFMIGREVKMLELKRALAEKHGDKKINKKNET